MSQNTSRAVPTRTAELTYIAAAAVLITVCAWITIPTTVPFTMQTFGIFTALGLLGGRRGTWAVLVYLLLGAVGLPVFSGFGAGPGQLLGATGGYLVGFLCLALICWLVTRFLDNSLWATALGMLLGLVVCYAFGTAWFLVVYARTSGPVGLVTALSWCVVPFVVPDCIKLALALLISRRLRPYVKL